MTRRQLAGVLALVFAAPRLRSIEASSQRLRVFGVASAPLGAALNGNAERLDFKWSGVAEPIPGTFNEP
jgi:hypothetical protein